MIQENLAGDANVIFYNGMEVFYPDGRRLPDTLMNAGGEGRPHKDVKTRVDPTMCMKTKRARQNVTPKMHPFTRKCTRSTVIDNNRADVLSEHAQLRDKSRQRGARRASVGTALTVPAKLTYE
jgi:hypothetical protein